MAALSAALGCSGCLCWFVPCDREYDVTGWVRAANGQPLGGAQASMSWDVKPTATDAAGCFSLHAHFAAPGFELTAEGTGFKSIHSSQHMGRYTVDVTLAGVDSVASSRMVFHELPDDAPRRECSDGRRRRPNGQALLSRVGAGARGWERRAGGVGRDSL